MLIVEERRRPLIIPAQTDIQRQAVVDFPIILCIDAELEILRRDVGVAAVDRGVEIHTIRDRVVERAARGVAHIIGEERVLILRVGVEFDPLRLHPDLEGVAFEPGPGEIVRNLPALLALVLKIAARADAQDIAAPCPRCRRYGGQDGVEQRDIAEIDRPRPPAHILIGHLEIIHPGVGRMLPAREPAPFLDLRDRGGVGSGKTVVQLFAALVAIFD